MSAAFLATIAFIAVLASAFGYVNIKQRLIENGDLKR